ncbi:MAG: hypothetical protein JSR44_14650 [Spirochaetes bacterium]|nr:hypothetical protein [Spirochaetota bacterium]
MIANYKLLGTLIVLIIVTFLFTSVSYSEDVQPIGDTQSATAPPAKANSAATEANAPAKVEANNAENPAGSTVSKTTSEQAQKNSNGEKAEQDKKKLKYPKKRTMKLSEDTEAPIAAKDPATYELSNRRLIEDYIVQDTHPYDRGEHMLISAFMGAIGGSVVGGLVGFSQYNSNNSTQSQNMLITYAGIGAGVGAFAGIFTTFFEQGKIYQFAIGKFLLKYSWYGALGGAVIGAGIGFIPYSSSGDTGDIFRYMGYGAGVGLLAGLTFFFIDLPEHIKLFSYQRADQTGIALALHF